MMGIFDHRSRHSPVVVWKKPWEMVICLDKSALSCVTYRRKIERASWVIWIELGFSGELRDVGLSCIIYTRKSGLRWLQEVSLMHVKVVRNYYFEQAAEKAAEQAAIFSLVNKGLPSAWTAAECTEACASDNLIRCNNASRHFSCNFVA